MEQMEEKYKNKIKMYTDGSKKDKKVACAVITPEWKTRKRMQTQKKRLQR
jgi:hypothetical protein